MAYGKTTEAIVELDDATRYVFHNYYNLLTPNETYAWKICLLKAKSEAAGNENYARFLSDKFYDSNREDILELLSKGTEKFFMEVRERILKEHKDLIIFNYCPKCGALARTPKAQICPACSFNWHPKASR
jgi:hypothetical protein